MADAVDLEERERRSYRVFVGAGSFSLYDTMRDLLVERGDWRVESNPAAIGRCELVLGDRFDIPYDRLRAEAAVAPCGPKPLVNYFKGSHKLTLKAAMARLLREAVPHIDTFMPRSFILGQAPAATKASRFRQVVTGPKDERDELRASDTDRPAMWIVKPSAGCKGAGITVCQTSADVVAVIEAAETAAAAEGRSGCGLYAVQEYIADPFLIGGRKFDIRVWAMIAPPFDIYVYNQGSCRTASVPYDRDDVSALLSHLTNHGLQESSPTFGQFEAGNELWYSALSRILEERTGGKTFAEVVAPQIDRIVVDSLFAAKELLEVGSHERFECFQIFGFDLLLDAQLRLHLVEINGSPGAADRWLEPLVTSTLELLVDPRFPPSGEAAAAAQHAAAARCEARAAKDGERGEWVKVWDATAPPPYKPNAVVQDLDIAVDVRSRS
jgi:tubulin--tyrosine ligase